MKLWIERDRFINVLNKLPRTLYHRDFNLVNIVKEKGNDDTEKTILFEWGCTGNRVVSEDVAHLLIENLVFYDYDTEKASELREIILSNYLVGLANAEWRGNTETVRIAFDLVMVLHWIFRPLVELSILRIQL